MIWRWSTMAPESPTSASSSMNLFFKARDSGHIYGIEARAELVEKSVETRATTGFARMSFLNLSVEESIQSPQLPQRIDIVTALHACDTATDDAIMFALHRQAQFIRAGALLPGGSGAVLRRHRTNHWQRLRCRNLAPPDPHPRIRQPDHQQSCAACCSRRMATSSSVTELVGWEHSMKNELIIARFTGAPRGETLANDSSRYSTKLNLDDLKGRFLY